MNTAERAQKRQALIAEGFQRTGCSDDFTGNGDYTEVWAHADGTTVTIRWATRRITDATPDVVAATPSTSVPAERLLALAADLDARKAHPGAFYDEAIAYAQGEESAWQGVAETLRDLVAEFTHATTADPKD